MALDTTSNVGSIALLDTTVIARSEQGERRGDLPSVLGGLPHSFQSLAMTGSALVELSWENASSHTSVLVLHLQELLKQSSLSLEEIDLWALTQGPGSFTGIRIGLAFVKGLTLLNEKPVIGISTLEAMAFTNPNYQTSLTCPILDAHREQIFAALYRQSAAGSELLIAEQAEFPEKFFHQIKSLKEIDSKKLMFLGSGAKKYADLIRKEWGNEVQIIPESPPLASFIGKLAFNKFQQGCTLLSSLDLSPSYLRGSAAEA